MFYLETEESSFFPGILDQVKLSIPILPSSPFSTENYERQDISDKEDLKNYETEENANCASILEQSKGIKKQKCNRQSRPTKNMLWKAEEDALLIELYEEYGTKWTQIANIMDTGKNGKQARDRYLNALKPGITDSEWTQEEDEHFTRLYEEFGNRWCDIAAQMPGRTENQVKNRFYWHKKKQVQRKVTCKKGPQVTSKRRKAFLYVQRPEIQTHHQENIDSCPCSEEIISHKSFEKIKRPNPEINNQGLNLASEILTEKLKDEDIFFKHTSPKEPSDPFRGCDSNINVDIYFAF